MMDDDAVTDGWDWMVLINDEEQYSLWPAPNPVPAGWHAVGPTGPKQLCLDYVEQTWTDMRPRTLRATITS